MVAKLVLLAWVTVWLLWVVALYAFPKLAYSDTYTSSYGTLPSYFTLIEDAAPVDNWFARIKIQNVQGSDNRIETVQTPHGDVVLSYKTSPGIMPASALDADSVCVEALPDGVIAAPPCVTVLEAEDENIFLLLFMGG